MSYCPVGAPIARRHRCIRPLNHCAITRTYFFWLSASIFVPFTVYRMELVTLFYDRHRRQTFNIIMLQCHTVRWVAARISKICSTTCESNLQYTCRLKLLFPGNFPRQMNNASYSSGCTNRSCQHENESTHPEAMAYITIYPTHQSMGITQCRCQHKCCHHQIEDVKIIICLHTHLQTQITRTPSNTEYTHHQHRTRG